MNVNDVTKNDVVLDVREDNEFNAGHVEEAIHIPLNELMARYEELPLDDTINVICRSGGRSAQATNWLNQHGVEAENIEGGMGAWMDEDLPMVSETGDKPYVV